MNGLTKSYIYFKHRTVNQKLGVKKNERYVEMGYKIIDYSSENIEFCNGSLYLPYQVNPDEILNYNKEFDVCYIGHPWGNRRVDKLQELKKSVAINIIGDKQIPSY